MIAVLVKTHFIDDALLEQLRTMRRALLGQPQVELVLGVDATAVPAAALGAVEAALPGLRLHGFHNARYAAHGLRPHAFLARMGAPLDWYHSDYSLIDFHLHHPHRYTALWQIEYDVSLRRGSWDFLGHDLPFDLLVPGLKIRERGFRALVHSSCILQPGWFWWDKLEGTAATVGGFFPCIRITPRALDHLVTAYRGGVSGYCEVSVPSVLACAPDMRVASLSVIDAAAVEITHPHWDKDRRSDRQQDLLLNGRGLYVD